MNIASEISDIERRLRLAGIPLQRLYNRANIDGSTWTRWRAGKNGPRLSNWLNVQRATDDLICEAASKRSAA